MDFLEAIIVKFVYCIMYSGETSIYSLCSKIFPKKHPPIFWKVSALFELQEQKYVQEAEGGVYDWAGQM